jgi:hypothetical protein
LHLIWNWCCCWLCYSLLFFSHPSLYFYFCQTLFLGCGIMSRIEKIPLGTHAECVCGDKERFGPGTPKE